MPRLKAQYLLPSHILASLSTETWQDVKNEYNSLLHLSIVDVELESWKHAIDSGAVKAESLQEAVFAAQYMFPNIHTIIILKILLTMPVLAATAERSFSRLRCLKTYLRSNMSETRLWSGSSPHSS